MSRIRRSSSLLALLIGACCAHPLAAQPPAKTTPRLPSIIPIPIPGGPILGLVPGAPGDAVILTPEKYRELLDRIEKLQAQLGAQAPIRPRSCEIEGKLEQQGSQAIVRLKLTFKVTTTVPKSIVVLGCQKAQAIDARADDGKVPVIVATEEDGLRAIIEQPGEHTIRLEMEAPVAPRGPKGADLGMEIGLPGAPITVLVFDPPGNTRRLQVTTRTPRPVGAPGPENETEQVDIERLRPGKGVPLGPVTLLTVAWESADRKPTGGKTVETDIISNVAVDEVLNEAKLRLRGGASDWRFSAPANADVSVTPWPIAGGKGPVEFAADRLPTITRPEPGQSIWRIQFRDPPQVDVQVAITWRIARPKTGPIPVGPIAMLDVTSQSGTVRVKAPLGLKASAALRGDTRRETDEATGETFYRYSYSGVMKAAPTEPPLLLTISPVAGTINARSRHELRLIESGWRLRSEIAVSPSRTEVESIELEVPAGLLPTRAEPREIVEGLTLVRDLGDGRRAYRVALVSPKRTSFSFVFEGDYSIPPSELKATLPLPKLLGVNERSADLVASVPVRFDLRGTFRVAEANKIGSWDYPLEIDSSDRETKLRGGSDRPIAMVQLAWSAVAATATVRSTADVTLDSGWARVVQRLSYRFGPRAPTRLRLLAPRRPSSLRVNRGSVEATADGWDLIVPADATREIEFVLTYALANSEEGQELTLPILVPEATDVTQVVRVWVASDRTVRFDPTAEWGMAVPEVVEDRPNFPALVLRASGPAMPPSVGLQTSSRGAEAQGPTIERIAIEGRATEEGVAIRARFWARDWGKSPDLIVPAAARNLEIYLLGKRAPFTEVGEVESERMVRLTAAAPGVLDVRYRLPVRRAGELSPPRLLRAELIGDTIWTIYPPSGRVPLVAGTSSANWSPGAFLSTLGLGGAEFEGPPALAQQAEPAVVRVAFVQRDGWAITCSAIGLVTIFGLSLASPRNRWRLVFAGLLIALILATVVPQPFSRAVFGALPGALAAILMLIAFHWARTRYRGRLGRISGFARSSAAVVRPSGIGSVVPKADGSRPDGSRSGGSR